MSDGLEFDEIYEPFRDVVYMLYDSYDYAAYAVILAHIGPVGLAVTTNLNINFLRKPEPGTLMCDGRIIKLGKRLCVVDLSIHKPGVSDLIAHATATYSIPPDR